ncbi:CerR family C-terminal domain-containing protein [uncultured Sphingomonas sp.]|uniref:CerR family C-terminal domain-containing protein n=1 Tax=uncultured Sphingomonas sp. TaxID=158754 RepID=UPI0035CA731A
MATSKLLDVAIREFGQRGLDGASTRGIAAAAGTAMSSITYHYGGKEGLYAAAVKHLDADMAEQLASVLPSGSASIPAEPAMARQEIRLLLDRLIERFLRDEDAERSLFIMREQMCPSAAFDHFYQGAIGRMAERLVALVQTASGVSTTDARITALALFGQVMVWRTSRALADRVLGIPIDEDCTTAIRRQIARNTDSILDRLSADQQEPQ